MCKFVCQGSVPLTLTPLSWPSASSTGSHHRATGGTPHKANHACGVASLQRAHAPLHMRYMVASGTCCGVASLQLSHAPLHMRPCRTYRIPALRILASKSSHCNLKAGDKALRGGNGETGLSLYLRFKTEKYLVHPLGVPYTMSAELGDSSCLVSSRTSSSGVPLATLLFFIVSMGLVAMITRF